MTAPLPHWPGRMLVLAGGERVWVAATPGLLPGAASPTERSPGAVPPTGGAPGGAPPRPAAPGPPEPAASAPASPAPAPPGGTAPDGGVPDLGTPLTPSRDSRELVLCVHGMTGSATNWTDLMADLAPDYDCAAVDLPGSGFSPPPAALSGYSVSALAGTVTRLIEALGAGPVHLVGNSMGGAVAVRAAARRPDLIRTLTLVSPALPDRKVRRSVLHFPLLGLPVVGERLVRQWIVRFPVENRVAGVFAGCFSDPSRVHPDRFALEVAELRRRDTLRHGPASLVRAARTLVAETLRPAPFSLWRAAGRVTAPSLVLFGADDRLIHPRLAARAERVFPDARVVVLPQTGHIAQMECPERVAGLFREMTASVRERGNAGRGHPVDA